MNPDGDVTVCEGPLDVLDIAAGGLRKKWIRRPHCVLRADGSLELTVRMLRASRRESNVDKFGVGCNLGHVALDDKDRRIFHLRAWEKEHGTSRRAQQARNFASVVASYAIGEANEEEEEERSSADDDQRSQFERMLAKPANDDDDDDDEEETSVEFEVIPTTSRGGDDEGVTLTLLERRVHELETENETLHVELASEFSCFFLDRTYD